MLAFSVVVPTRGEPAKLAALLDRLRAQTLDRSRWELILAVDGASIDPVIVEPLARAEARAVMTPERRGPGAARNRGARAAAAPVLAFTEDDCSPDAEWLAMALARFEQDPELDVLVGATVKPGGRRIHRQSADAPLYLPTNLFVRRTLFESAGGYCEAYFDAANGVYFREDSDLGFTLERLGARVATDDRVRVEHPDEHPRLADPLRWARRHEMDALLAARHPGAFRERIETHRLGPLRIRRPIVRASVACVVAVAAAAAAALAGSLALSASLLVVAGIALALVWAKWRFDPRRLPVVPLVPFVLLAALLRGRARVRHLGAAARTDRSHASSPR